MTQPPCPSKSPNPNKSPAAEHGPAAFPEPPALGQPLERRHFDYPLPLERIAQHGLAKRSEAKLLVSANGQVADAQFSQLAHKLPKNSLIVMNDTKVFPSRLLGRRASGGKVEVFLLTETDAEGGAVRSAERGAVRSAERWAMVKPLKKLTVGEVIQVGAGPDGAEVTILAKEQGRAKVALTKAGQPLEGDELMAWLSRHGIVPLPPYIARDVSDQQQRQADLGRYQTVYAKEFGSVAAPTAGLHFDEAAMAALRAAGHEFAPITLHVGAGTFLPVKTEQISAHRMHAERFYAPSASLAAIDQARRDGRPIIAVGTTSFRCLESLRRLAESDGTASPLAPYGDRWRATELFVYEEQRRKRFTEHFFAGLLTNFHQPESTLLMLMAALVGYDEIMAVYRHALANHYRFLSYGDSGLYLL